ncbi:MAG: amino acid aldolase [Halobacteriovoraceae bacterium]|nr:amino acid aldolase [Halobacteriovoraceae bacterium]
MEDLIYKDFKAIFNGHTPPYSFLFLDELDKNIDLSLKRAGDKQIRVATKSVRSKDVLKYLAQKLGNRFNGFMCFHLDEVLWLSEHFKTSFLMGYPQKPNEVQARKLAQRVQAGHEIIFMVDSTEQLEHLNRIGEMFSVKFEYCLDLDMSLKLPGLNFGVFRSPLDNQNKVDQLVSKLKDYEHVSCVGLMGYEAQIAGVRDKLYDNFLLDFVVGLLKSFSVKKVYQLRAYATKKASELFKLKFVNGGGTGSLEVTAKDHSVTEITVGSGYFAPALFDGYDKRFHPALGYAMAVQRRPSESMFTVHGGGYVASGAVGRDKAPVIISPKGASLIKNEMAGEVQTPVEYKGLQKIELGDPVFFRHSKAGELLERFKDILVVREGKIQETWKSYRGEEKCFL